jgi:transcription antitermination factor NusG
VDASCSGEFLSCCTHRITEDILQAGLEKILAVSLSQISTRHQEDYEIQTFHHPCFPRRIYIKAPGILEIQKLMKFSAYGSLASRATRIMDDIDLNLLLGTNVSDVPCPGSWVRIKQACIYKGDLALVLYTPSEGDIVTIAVVPRFSVSQSKKRKGNGLFARAPLAPALLDPKIVAKFPSDEHNVHSIGSRRFYPNGLEFLQTPSVHSLKIEPSPSEAELLLFQSSFGLLDTTYEHEHIIQRAVYEAFHNKSKMLWHAGDRVRILEGTFVNILCSILEIDELNQSAIVEFGPPKPMRVEVMMYDLERQFLVGDQVRVALGENKGRTGSIVEIIDDVATIVEGTASQLTEVTPPLPFILLHLLIILPSSKSYCCILRAIS